MKSITGQLQSAVVEQINPFKSKLHCEVVAVVEQDSVYLPKTAIN
jgi:hypothetical protein